MTAATIQNLLAALPVIAALLVLRVANAPRARRHQQYALPAVAVLYALAALVVLYRFNERLDGLLASLFSLVPILEPLYQVQWLYIIENTAVVLLFLVLKYPYRVLAGALFAGDRFPGSIVVERFYEYDASSGRWFVRERSAQVRLLFRVLFWASVGATAILVFAMRQAPDWPGFSAMAFPAVATLVVGDVFYALDGGTRAEAGDLIGGERDSARRIVNYAALREVFRGIFRTRILDEGVDLSHPYAASSNQALQDLARSEDGIDQLFAEYYARAKRSGDPVDENLVHASLGMLRGTSTLINSPFYRDLTGYLALPAYIRLLRGGKTLIVVGRDAVAEETADWFAKGLERITGAPGLWDVRVLGEQRAEGLDVGVLRAADLHNVGLLRANDDFLRETETVILIEPSRLLATGQLGLGVVVSRLARGEQPVYVALDRNHDGLVDALSHLLKVSLTDVVATQQALGASSEMVWKAEGPHAAAQIMPGLSRYLGLGTEIAAVALKYHVSEVEWVGGDRFPVTDMSWIAGQYYGKITSFAELEPSQRALSTALLPCSNPWGLARTERRFLVVEDELSNVYESLRLFASRSTESGFINLISENYLMRDYMVDNRALFSIDPKAIPAIVPDHARSRRNTVLRLLVMLSGFGVAESVLLRELELVGSVPDAPEGDRDEGFEAPVVVLLRELIERYTGLAGARFVRMPGFSASSTEQADGYRIEPDGDTERVLRRLGSAYFLVEDETEGRDYIGGCLHDHVAQTVLPGQFITVGGKHYEVVGLGEEGHREEVLLRRAAEHISGRPAYRPLMEFSIDSRRTAEATAPRIEGAEVTVERQTVSMRVDTRGYLELPNRAGLGDARRVLIDGLESRRYLEKDALRIALPDASPAVRRTIALLLNELFVTVFPTAHPFVVALALDPERSLGDLLPAVVVDDEEAVYIVEDSTVDLGLVVAVERNWQRLFEIVTDYLQWAQEPQRAVEEAPIGTGATVVFEGESAEEIAERERRIAEAEEKGAYAPPRRPTWWRRVLTRLRNLFRRRSKPEVEEAPGNAPGTASTTAQVVESGSEPASEGPSERPSEPVAEPVAAVERPLEVSFEVPAPLREDDRDEESETEQNGSGGDDGAQ